MKKSILFVDDDPNVLSGLQRMLRPFRHEWDMCFALSGEEALTLMAQRPMDIVVADMRMPGMNGAELLAKVMTGYPATIRIILSGQANEDLISRSLVVTHQYLAKPCDPDLLRATVARATELQQLLAECRLKQLVSQMGHLPSLPSIYYQLVRELQSSEASIQRAARIISEDPAMTAKILQVVNSSFFGLRRQVSNPLEAVSYLGIDRIQQLCLTVHAFAQFQSSDTSGFFERLWNHCVSTAARARRIAKLEQADKRTADESFTAGLLHDIGQLMLSSRLPREYCEAHRLAKIEGLPLWKAEREILRASHAEVGAYLLGLWGLPHSVVEAVAYHHHPSDCSCVAFSPLVAAHAADVLEHLDSGPDGQQAKAVVDQAFLSRLELAQRFSVWHEYSRTQAGDAQR